MLKLTSDKPTNVIIMLFAIDMPRLAANVHNY